MIGRRLAERYEILGEIGRGGMGVVYRARDPLLERDVAVKLISLAKISAESEERFMREARIVAQMDHPGIVPIYDLGEHEDALFFIMPLVLGKTLKVLLRQHALAAAEILEVVAQVAEALGYSQDLGVVHRDIKPSNLMVTREKAPRVGFLGAYGNLRVRVMDFGLALMGASSRLTKTGTLPGTLMYLSPEQILSAEVDGRSDLYSLGTILYEALAGEPPFSGSRYSLLYRIAHEPPPALTTYGVGEDLQELVLRCLAKDPAERPAHGSELAEALRRHRAELEHLEKWQGSPVRTARRPDDESAGFATPLVGRRRELEELRRHLGEAVEGEGRLVLVGGDSGLGKTRLLKELRKAAHDLGIRVLQGRFSGEGAFPYQGFGELFHDFFRVTANEKRGADRAVRFGDLASDLLALFPALQEIPALRVAAGGEPSLSAAAAAEDPTRIFELLARALVRLGGGYPLVLVFEQLHASETAIEALLYLVRRLASTPTLIVGTYRPSELARQATPERLRRGFEDDPRVTSLELEPLSLSEHRELLTILLAADQLQGELVDKLYGLSEGNPLFIEELVRWLLETGALRRAGDGNWMLSGDPASVREALPETIQEAIEARLEQLSENRLALLRTASILGRRFDVAALEALSSGVSGDELDEALDELIHEGLLEEDRTSRQDHLIFTSRWVREILEHGLSRRRRRILHRRYAEWLETDQAGRLERVRPALVHHFAEGDVAGKTIFYARSLAREALGSFAWETAIQAVGTALEFVEEETVDGAVESELRRLMARALLAEGRLELALKEATRASRAAERAATPEAGAVSALLAAEIAWQGRRVEETRRWVARGSDLARRFMALSPAAGGLSSNAGDAGDVVDARDTVDTGGADATGGQVLRRFLVLGATLANLGGEHDKARLLLDEAAALGEAETAEVIPRGGVLVTSLSSPPRSCDLEAVPRPEEMEILGNVIEPLLSADEQGNLLPVLCRSFTGSPDGRQFRFELRRDVRFSDGEELRPSHVRDAFERAVRRRSPAPALAAVAGVDRFRAGEADHLEGLSVDGDVLSVNLQKPLPIFPALLADLRVAIVREDPRGGLLGTGPFRLAEGCDSGRYLLERNPHWHGDPVPLDGIEMLVMPSSDAVTRGFSAGHLDLGRDLLSADLETVLRDPRFQASLVETVTKDVHFVLLNADGPVTRHVELRRCLVGTVRARDLVWRTLGRLVQPATGLIPPGILGHDPGRRSPEVRRDDARRILAEHGFEAPVRLQGIVHPLFRERYRELTEALFEEWAAIGIEVSFDDLSLEEFLERTRQPEGIDFSIGRWVHDFDDPDNFTHDMMHSRGGALARHLGSPVLDDWIERARHEMRPSSRQRLYFKIESHLAREALVLPLFYGIESRIKSPRVRGLRLSGSPPFVNYCELGKLPEEPTPSEGFSGGWSKAGTIHVAIPEDLPDLAPDRAIFVGASEALSNVYETLARLEEGAHVVPALATDLRASDGGQSYLLRLRPNVRFHDGRRLSVRDVRYSVERLLRSSRGGAKDLLLPIRGARAFAAGETDELEGFRVVSSRELVLELEEPLAFFPTLLTSPATAIVPEGAMDFRGNWREGATGTGPFRVVRLAPGERLELEANPHYWRPGRPRTDRLVFELARTPEQISVGLRDGRLTLAGHLPPKDLEKVLHDTEPTPAYVEAPGFSTYYLVLNIHGEVFGEARRRLALRDALDIQELARETLGRVAVPAEGLIPPGLLGHETTVRPSPGESQESLSGRRVRCAVHSVYREVYGAYWSRLEERLRGLGIELEIVPLGPEEALVSRIDADLVATRWVVDYPDADGFVHLLHSRDGLDGALCGLPAIDRLIDRGRRETDPALRHTIYQEVEYLLRQEALVIPLFHEQIYRVVRPEVAGLRLGWGAPEVAYDELVPRSRI